MVENVNTTISQPWAPQIPYITQGYQGAQQNYNTPKNFYPNNMTVPFSPQSESAMQGIEQRAITGNPLLQQAQQHSSDVLSALGADTHKDRFAKGLWPTVLDEDGKARAMPWEVNPLGFFYRKDMFDKAGLDPTAFATWDDVIDAAVFTPFTLLPDDQFTSWGWRIPFLLSILILPVGLYIRMRVAETPAFDQAREQGERTPVPALDLARNQPGTLLRCLLANIGPNVATYVPSVYALTYIEDDLGMAASVGTVGLLIANSVKVVTLPLSGALSDRWGRKPVFASGAVLCALLAFPFFWLLDTGHSWVVWIAMTLMLTFANDLMLGAQAAMLPEQFDTPVRYTGVAVSREFAAAIAGGTLPFIAAALTALTGGTWALSTLMIFMCALSLIGVAGLRDGRELSFVEEGPRLEKEIASPR